MLTLRDVTAGYGGGNVLQGVDLHCDDRTVTCIVGPNGAGKSTVLKVISGLLRCAGGSIEMGGTRTDGMAPDAILKLGITQVPQSQALFPQMSVRENVLLGGYVRRRDKELLRRRYDELTAMFPIIAERAADPAGNLSGGQRRMVEFARALMIDPRVVLLDEPSLGLDPKALGSVCASVAAMREAGMTVLLVEQNVRFGLGIATHGVVMESGRVLLTDTAEGLSANQEIGELFLGGVPR